MRRHGLLISAVVMCSHAIFARHACDRTAAMRSAREGMDRAAFTATRSSVFAVSRNRSGEFQCAPASSQAAMVARSSPVISVTLPGGIALDHAALRPISRALRRI